MSDKGLAGDSDDNRRAAREHAGLKEGFDLDEEMHYNMHRVELYRAFLAGCNHVMREVIPMLEKLLTK